MHFILSVFIFIIAAFLRGLQKNNMDHIKTQAIVFGALGAALAGVGGYLMWQKMSGKKYPTRWKQIGTLGEMYIYPIKSGKYLKLKEALCGSLGLLQISDEEYLPLRDRFIVTFLN